MSMFSLGIMVGGVASGSKQAGVIASLLYFPMLIFSGTTVPYEMMPEVMQKMANLLPLTQGIKLLKSASFGQTADNVLIPAVIMVVLAIICTAVSLKFFKWES